MTCFGEAPRFEISDTPKDGYLRAQYKSLELAEGQYLKSKDGIVTKCDLLDQQLVCDEDDYSPVFVIEVETTTVLAPVTADGSLIKSTVVENTAPSAWYAMTSSENTFVRYSKTTTVSRQGLDNK